MHLLIEDNDTKREFFPEDIVQLCGLLGRIYGEYSGTYADKPLIGMQMDYVFWELFEKYRDKKKKEVQANGKAH